MRLKWSVALFAAVLTAGEIDPRLLRLIGPGVRLVYGLDLERYDGTVFSKVYPPEQFLVSYTPLVAIRHVFGFAVAPGDPELDVIVTAAPIPAMTGEDVMIHRGVHVHGSKDRAMAVIAPSIAVVGQVDRVREAIDRWFEIDAEITGSAAKARDLSRSYDSWFFVLRPLDFAAEPAEGTPSRYRAELGKAVEEVRFGLRMGATHDVTIEAVARSAEEATALAVLARYLPGLFDMQGRQSAILVEVVEHLTAVANGKTATLTFSVAEQRLADVVRELEKRRGIE